MKNFLVSLIILLILSSAAYSATSINTNLEKGESIIVGGRNFTLLSVSTDKMLMSIDEEQKILSTIEEENFDDIYISVSLIYWPNKWMNLSIDINISTDFTCGNKVCESSSRESSLNCCLDCKCPEEYSCYKNKCIKSNLIKCFSDSECNDNNSCTLDSCGGTPVIACNNIIIAKCIHNDSCCPINCSFAEDNDCIIEGNISNTTQAAEENQYNQDSAINDTNITAAINETAGINNTNTTLVENTAAETNQTTEDADSSGEWHSERKTSAVKRFFIWLLGWI